MNIGKKIMSGFIITALIGTAMGIYTGSAAKTFEPGRTVFMVIAVIVIVLLISIIMGVFVSGSITKPLRKTAYMIHEISKGHFAERIHLNTKDEIGAMARAVDFLADELQTKVVTAINKISKGDVAIEMSAEDRENEIISALMNMVDTLNKMNRETRALVQSLSEGKLSTRGKEDCYPGCWGGLTKDINSLLDKFAGQFDLMDRHIQSISQGHIPSKITEEYQGDFNEIKNHLNTCTDVVNRFIEEISGLTAAVQEGKLDKHIHSDGFNGSWLELAGGVDNLINTFIGSIKIMEEYMGRIGRGEIPEAITGTYPGGFNDIKYSINSCINGLNGLNECRDILELMTCNDLTKRVEGTYQGIYAEIAVSVNTVANRFSSVIKTLHNISIGEYDEDLKMLKGLGKKCENDTLVPATIQMIEDIDSLLKATERLTSAAIAGNLNMRENTAEFSGVWKKLVAGMNNILAEVAKPIQEVICAMNEMSKGSLQVSVTGSYGGSFDELKQAINTLIARLGTVISETNYTLGQIAGGNLDLDNVQQFSGNFSDITASLNVIIESLNTVMSEINRAAEQVSAGSKQISDGGQTLSQGSTEQASSIEELTASISEIAAQIKKNALNANEVNDLADDAKQKAAKGNERMKEMLRSMQEIGESSDNISRIIKVIDDIAFQTNILALNAAVEAARAGQHGKGFAVVAEEVRNLAGRSADAARDTAELIKGSINKVQAGTDIANETAAELGKIVEGIGGVAVLAADIASASNEQASAVSQINQGIEQVSQVVQHNSATAEQSAAASIELSDQARSLKDTVGQFKLKGEEKKILSLNDVKLLDKSPDQDFETVSRPKISMEAGSLDKY